MIHTFRLPNLILDFWKGSKLKLRRLRFFTFGERVDLSPGSLRLKGKKGSFYGKEFIFPEDRERILIGRSRNCDIILSEEGASKEHAEIRKRGDKFLLIDLKSTNGTLVNGKKAEVHILSCGDLIQIEEAELKVEGERLTPKTVPRRERGKIYLIDEKSGERYALDKSTIRIGRNEENDIIIPEPTVSAHHAEIRKRGEKFILIDLDSDNGTFLNGRRVKIAELKGGERISFDIFPFSFFNPSPRHTLIRERRRITEIREKRGKAIITIKNGPLKGKRYSIDQKRVILGRSPKCDIPLPDPSVSMTHSLIEEKDGVFYIEDLTSTNGTLLNGRLVKRMPLPKRAKIELGRVKLAFRSIGKKKGKKLFGRWGLFSLFLTIASILMFILLSHL